MGTMDREFNDPTAKPVGRKVAEIVGAMLVLLVVVLVIKALA
jgi:hypothetical protein